MGNCYDDTEFGEDDEYEECEKYDFGRRRGRPRKMAKGRGYIMVRGRKRKLYKGKNGALFYRTRSGRSYIKRRLSRFGEMEPEYTDMEFGAKLAASKVLKVLQEIADGVSPGLKYSSQIGKGGRPKLLTVNALKRKLTKNNIDWKRMVELAMSTDPRYIPTRGQKFKGGVKYLRMVANKWFGTEFKYSNKIDKKGRPKLLSETALKKRLSAALKSLGRDWRDEANAMRETVLEIYKNLKSSFQYSGIKKTTATKLSNKIMKDNEDGISMGPGFWYGLYKQEVQRGKNPESAAWDATGETLRSGTPLADIAALPPVPIGRGGRQTGYENFDPPGSMAERWQMDADSGYLGQTPGAARDNPYARAIEDMQSRPARPGGMGYRAFIDGLISEGVRPGSEEMGRREDEWRRSRANSMNQPSAEAIAALLPPLSAPAARGMFGGGYSASPGTFGGGDSLPVGGPGGGDLFNNDLSERLLGFGMNYNQMRSSRRSSRR